MTTIARNVQLLRSKPARGLEDTPRIDRKAGIIYGFSVIQRGPALGHDMDIDETTLDQVVELGNAAKGGAKMRFTHPTMSNDGLGKYMGRAKNFRKDGDRVRADAHISDTAYDTPMHGDLASYVFDLAEEDPTAFASSIAYRGKSETRLNPDGTPMRGVDGKKLDPVARIERLAAVDLVDSPAANRDGLFSELDLPDWPARQVTAVLDHLFSDATPAQVQAKANEFISKYLSTRVSKMDPSENNSTPAALTVWNADKKCFEAAPGVELSAEQLAALNPKPPAVEAPKTEPAPAPLATGQLSEVEQERERALSISAACQLSRLPDAHKLAQEYIKGGLSTAEVVSQLATKSAAFNAPLSDESVPNREKPADSDAEFKKQYAEGKAVYLAEGITEEQFCRTQRISAGLEPLVKVA